MKKDVDYSVYLVTDRRHLMGRELVEVMAAAIDGGTTVLQFRDKESDDAFILEEGEKIRSLCRRRGVTFILNDRPDLAKRLDADGVHVGQSDASLADARRLLGAGKIVGVSAGTLDEALAAERGGADYIGLSPVFDTPSKTDTPVALGLGGVKEIRRAVRIPLVAIGGIDETNAAEVVAAGADGVAVIRAIMAAPDPGRAARSLRRIVTAAGPRARKP